MPVLKTQFNKNCSTFNLYYNNKLIEGNTQFELKNEKGKILKTSSKDMINNPMTSLLFSTMEWEKMLDSIAELQGGK